MLLLHGVAYLLVYPWHILADPGVDPWLVLPAAAIAPAGQPHQGGPQLLCGGGGQEADSWAPTVPLAGVHTPGQQASTEHTEGELVTVHLESERLALFE